jgi:hypothetical protein
VSNIFPIGDSGEKDSIEKDSINSFVNTLFDNITAMSNDTNTNMSSQKIKFFLWTNLAIVIAIISVRILRN